MLVELAIRWLDYDGVLLNVAAMFRWFRVLALSGMSFAIQGMRHFCFCFFLPHTKSRKAFSLVCATLVFDGYPAAYHPTIAFFSNGHDSALYAERVSSSIEILPISFPNISRYEMWCGDSIVNDLRVEKNSRSAPLAFVAFCL